MEIAQYWNKQCKHYHFAGYWRCLCRMSGERAERFYIYTNYKHFTDVIFYLNHL